MSKIIIVLLIMCILLGCSSPNRIETTLKEKIDNIEIETVTVGELMISQKLVYFLSPLVLSLFISIILIFSGVRLIGLGVLVSSITCIILVVSLAVYMKYVAFIGLLVMLVGLYFLGKELFDKYIYEKDLVSSVEQAKLLISYENKEKLKKTLNKLQSSTTKSKVKKHKT